MFKNYTFHDFTKFRLSKEGLFSLGNLRSTIEQEMEVDNIEDLKIPLILGVSNILSGKSEYITEDKFSAHVETSASIHVLFSPVEINGNL